MAYLDPAAGLTRETRSVAGAPVAGTDEVQTITITGTPTGGTFRLAYKGQVTDAIAYNAAAAAVELALEALSTVGAGNGTCAGGPLPGTAVTVTFTGALAKKAVPLITVFSNDLTGGTDPDVAVTETTPGVDASYRGAPVGAQLTDTTNGELYINSGSSTVPVWTLVGSQT